MLWGGPAPPLLEADHEVQSHLVELGAARTAAEHVLACSCSRD